jgi:hypothetical protein
MKYQLFDNEPDSKKAEELADKIIDKFLEQMQDWSHKYRHVGASDTASREAFAVNTAYKLKLKHYYN